MKFSVVFLSLLLLQGCATLVSKSQYPVLLSSEPEGAAVEVFDDKGVSVFKGSTPVRPKLKSGSRYFIRAKYIVSFEKSGYAPAVRSLVADVDPWYALGNAFPASFIGYVVVDPATGAMWKIEEDVHVELSPENSSP